jgi:malonate decarboxylase epsilon subunit
MTIALLFPGQGSQRPGMLNHLPDTPAAAGAYAEALDALSSFKGLPSPIDSIDALASTTNAQLALVVAGVVTARALVDDHRLRVDAVAGHSVGAFSAAVIAGVLGLSDALSVVKVRGTEMERACAGGAWGMAALRGLPPTSVQRLVEAVSTKTDPLWIANINASDQIVVSGTRIALDALRLQAPEAGATALTVLDVSVASHCPLQAETAQAVARALVSVGHGEQRLAYFTNTTGRRVSRDTSTVIDDLAEAVRRPVRWYDAIQLMPEVGITATIQMPPGHVLTSISSRETPAVTSVAIDGVGIASALVRTRGANEL